jgi:hypothetical protein
VIDAYVDKKGKVEIASAGMRAEWREWLWSLRESYVDLRATKMAAALTDRQRRWYFGQVLGRITEKTGQPRDDLHDYYKDLFLGSPENKTLVLVDRDGCIVDERDVWHERSITLLSRRAMSEYCDQIRAHAADQLHVFIPDADPSKAKYPRKTRAA